MVERAAASSAGAFDLLHACADARSRSEFAALALPRLHALIGCDEISLADVSPTVARTHRATGFPTPPHQVPLAIHTLRTRLAEHPWYAAHRARGVTTALRVSDLMSQRELRRTPFYSDFYRPRGLAFAAYSPIVVTGDHLVVIGLGRRTRDFSADEHLLFERLRAPLGALWRAAQAGEPARPQVGELTGAERRVAELVGAGLSNRAAAEHLGVSVKAVEQHLTRVYRRLGVGSRVQLALALRHHD